MSKRSPLPSQPPHAVPNPAPTSPPVEYYNPGATVDAESECNEVLDHGGEPLPLPANSKPPAVLDEVIAPPVCTPSPDPHPRPPSPIGIGARLPMHNRHKPREWWKLSPAQMDDPDQMEESDDELAMSASLPDEPLTFAEALTRPDAEKWRQAVLKELAAHQTNGTWTLVPRPAGSKVIGSKWVFKVRRNVDGSIDRYKAQLVAKGYNQQPGFDYLEVFAPTVRLSSIRVILTLAALQDLHLHSLDISHAYLNGEMDCEGFVEGDPKAKVCLLQRAIYGSKQGRNRWNKKMHSVLESLDFRQTYSDASIYIYAKDGITIILPVFIDDMTLASKSEPAIKSFIAQLSQHFKIHDLGPITQLLGIKIDRDHSKHSILPSQRQYCLDILDRFGMADCKPISTPMEPGLRLSHTQSPQDAQESATMHQTPYLSAVGALMYLAPTTHPDIAYTV